MDNIMAQLQMVNPSKQDQKDDDGCLLLALKSHNDTVSANPYCQVLQKPLPHSWTNVRVNSVMALSCCTTMMPHVAHRVLTKWVPQDGRSSNIMYKARTYCHVIFRPLDH